MGYQHFQLTGEVASVDCDAIKAEIEVIKDIVALRRENLPLGFRQDKELQDVVEVQLDSESAEGCNTSKPWKKTPDIAERGRIHDLLSVTANFMIDKKYKRHRYILIADSLLSKRHSDVDDGYLLKYRRQQLQLVATHKQEEKEVFSIREVVA
ncbi:hypothetical protein BGZ58_005739 [Dissophora ornata]|nr:hypothetical protein BGZ58_005739 [Dissophora ornata]